MFHPESNPLAPKPTGPLKPEKELVEIWLGKDAAAEMDERGPEVGDEDDLNFNSSLTEQEKRTIKEAKEKEVWSRKKYIKWAKSFGKDEAWVNETFIFDRDGTTSVEGDLFLSDLNLSTLPRGWKRIGGNLDLSRNQFTSLKGLPSEIGGHLNLNNNQLTSLEGMSKKIGGTLLLEGNQLSSLEGLPEEIMGDLRLANNPVESIPAGLTIGRTVAILHDSQRALGEDARSKGYQVSGSY